MSIFNEKKESRILSMIDNYEDDEEGYGVDGESESFNLMSRRSCIFER